MQDHEKTILELIIMGGLIGVAKVLVGSEHLTFRLVAGRAVLGSRSRSSKLRFHVNGKSVECPGSKWPPQRYGGRTP